MHQIHFEKNITKAERLRIVNANMGGSFAGVFVQDGIIWHDIFKVARGLWVCRKVIRRHG